MRTGIAYRRVGVALLIALMTALLALPVSLQAQGLPSAQAALYEYYTHINQRDFQAAYAMWSNPQQTFQQFQNGFTGTARVVPYFNPLESTGGFGNAGTVRAVLIGYQTDGTVQTYAGCFNLGLIGNQWRITESDFVRIDRNIAQPPDVTTINAQLGLFCGASATAVPFTPQTLTPQTAMLHWYYDAVNTRRFQEAYNTWLAPVIPGPGAGPAQEYRPTFANFEAGYANTEWVYVYPGAYKFMGAAAGHSYLDGMQPAVLVGHHSNGTFVTYYGCYIVGHLPTGGYGIVNGRFYLLDTQPPLASTIAQYQNIDCTTLAIPN